MSAFFVTAIDNNGASFIVFFSLIPQESEADLAWAILHFGTKIKNWTNMVVKLCPPWAIKRVRIVRTDGFAGYDGLCKQFFPRAQHQLCIWHLSQRVPSRIISMGYNIRVFFLLCVFVY